MKMMKNPTRLKSLIFLLGSALIFASCGANTNNKEAGPDEVNDDMSFEETRYKKDSVIFCLSFLSNINEGRYGSETALQDSATSCVNDILNDQSAIDLIGNWTTVWGPITYTEDGLMGDSCVSDNTMMLLQGFDPDNQSDTMYVLAMSGTVSASAYDWFVEDTDLDYMAKWPEVIDGSSNVTGFKEDHFPEVTDDSDITKNSPFISNGLKYGLDILFNKMKDESGVSIIDFMEELFVKSNSQIEIAVAGHSLGGALSPCVALSLIDNQSYWNPSGNCKVTCYATAGFSPGNDKFADYFAANIGDGFNGACNSYDLAINVYENTSLLNASKLYNTVLGDCLPLNDQKFMDAFLSCCSGKISKFKYTSIYQQSDLFAGTVSFTNYTLDTLYSNALITYQNGVGSFAVKAFDNAANTLKLTPSDSLFAHVECFGLMALQEHVNAYIEHFGVQGFYSIYSKRLAPAESMPTSVLHYLRDRAVANEIFRDCLGLESDM
ncbi:MAG: hypothetical protein ACJASQ_001179 [Crocinitomicaceae bacterium]|jgi:hypothetical protein